MSKFSPLNWPVVRQMLRGDLVGRDKSTQSAKSQSLHWRTVDAVKVVQSVCLYCAVGCSQRVYVKDDRVVHIEGDPDSPISRGRLCPKGAASEQLVNSATRLTKIKYRAPYATQWQDLDLETAMDMIADRFIASR